MSGNRSINIIHRNNNKEITLQSTLEKFCKDNLAYLIDYGFEVKIDREWGTSDRIYDIKIFKHGNDVLGFKTFRWDDIKYDFMQFIILLTNNYELFDYITFYDFTTENQKKDMVMYCIDEIIDDKVKDVNLYKIIIRVK